MVTPSNSLAVTLLRGLAGAALGMVFGYFAFVWILRQGYYAMVLPGALVGIGCSIATGRKSIAAGVLAGVIALALGIALEALEVPFVADGSIGYFLTHLHKVLPLHLLMIGLGAACGYWFGQGRSHGGVPPRREFGAGGSPQA